MFSRSIAPPFKALQTLSALTVSSKVIKSLAYYMKIIRHLFHDDMDHSNFIDVDMLDLDDSEGSK